MCFWLYELSRYQQNFAFSAKEKSKTVLVFLFHKESKKICDTRVYSRSSLLG